MRTASRRWSFPVHLIAATAAAFAPLAASAQNGMDAVVTQRVAQTRSSVVDYWSAERMRAARPLPLRSRTRTGKTPRIRTFPAPSGSPVIAPSGGPGATPGKGVMGSTRSAPSTLAGTFPFVFSRYRLSPNFPPIYWFFPHRAIGKVFFTVPGEGDFVCSGASVNAPNNSLVWTAGHCVFTPGVGFHTNFVFVPARHEGVDQFQTWTANTLGTTDGWMNDLLEYDHGAAFMNPGGPGGDEAVGLNGFVGFAANLPRTQHWHVVGYPAEPPFDGEHQEICASVVAAGDQPTGVPGTDPPTTGLGCDQTGGSSGGPWLINFNGTPGGTNNLLNGNISYGYAEFPNELYGPYFGAAAVHLRDTLGSM